ncbi:MAG: hypothetical protein WCK67_02420 [bacterium]
MTHKTNFLREVSKKKLEKLVELAPVDPYPLYRAARIGIFRNIRRVAIDYLENEIYKAKHQKLRHHFQIVIDILKDEVF